ncbi:MAG TPA: helicase [Clostridiales bacterium]|nr:helicase [Lachnospiraceae bacterium]HCS72390.1 helicase [Clostridiales bacterium]
MAGKFEYISKLADKTAKNIIKNEAAWKQYLDTAARLYKYPFQEQLLIYAQRPNAAACASIEIWNGKMNCWVNKGATGIALIDEESPYPKLKYVFDVADVHKAKRIGRTPYLWKMREEHADAIIARLENIYGSTDQSHGFPDRLLEIAERIAYDCYEDAADDMAYLTQGSFLEELDEHSLQVRLRDTLQASIAYTLLSRCGVEPDIYADEMNFQYISDFNSVPVLSQLGTSITEQCKPVLMEIGKTIHAYDLEISKKSIANTTNQSYNALKRESEGRQPILRKTPHLLEGQRQEEKEEENNERRIDVSEERRLLHSEYQNGRTATDRLNKIRADEKELSEGIQERNLFGDAAGRQTDGTFVGGSGSSGSANGNVDKPDGKDSGSGRGAKKHGSDALGTDDEQYQTVGGGNNFRGTDLQLKTEDIKKSDSSVLPDFFDHFDRQNEEVDEYQQISLFPSMDEQVGNITLDHADDLFALSMENLISDEMIDYVLLSGGGESNSRSRIFSKYQKGLDHKTMTGFLKREYRLGGKGFTFEKDPLCVWYEEKSMNFSRGTSARYTPMRTLTWAEVEQRTYDLINSGRYMDEAELWQVPLREKEELSSKIYFFFRDEYGSLPANVTKQPYSYPEAQAEIIEHLSTMDGINRILQELDKAMDKLSSGEVEPQIRLIYRPENIRESVKELTRKPVSFPIAASIDIPEETFITQDEIDYTLSRGSRFENGLFRIYEYFLDSHDKVEQASFLKHEYGIGGFSGALAGATSSFADYNSKGFQLKKGSICDPTAEVLFAWPKVAERVQKLIDTDRFLTPQKKEQYEKWKNAKEQEKVIISDSQSKIDEEAKDLEQIQEGRSISHSEEQQIQRYQYKIHNDSLGVGTPKEKFQANINAIQILKQCEAMKRYATKEEQEILSGYVGWGGLSEAFDETKSSWSKEYYELKNILTAEEYRSARESTLTAFYTPPVVIRFMHQTLENMGLKTGNLLEPCCGIGNFFGMMPEGLSHCKTYGVELDSISGRIAAQLYQKSQIMVQGFEKTNFPDSFFDAAIGNVPFGQFKVTDKRYDKHNFLIHDYFFAKTLDKLRTGGVIAFTTSSGTMDKKNPAVRKYIAQRAELVGAVRLPNTVFKQNAGTEVTSDILFFQKRDRVMDLEPEWVHLGENENNISMNQYFITHPEMILGKMELVSGPYGMEATCSPLEGKTLAEQLSEVISSIHATIEDAGLYELDTELEKAAIPADPDVKNYSYTIMDGDVYYREDSVMKPLERADSLVERIKGMVALRNATQTVINYQLEEYDDSAIKEKQSELSDLYDNFIKQFGLINSHTNKRAFNQDSSYCLLCSLEVLNEDGTLNRKADMFTKRTIKRREAITSVDTPTEALALSLNEKGNVDIRYMAFLLGDSENTDRVIKGLSSVIFKDPLSDLDDLNSGWMTGDEYLSGNVREKLEIAKLCAENHPEYSINVTALEQVQPKTLDASEIEVRLGATWVDTEYVNDFMHEIFGTPQNKIDRGLIGVQYSETSGQWNIKGKGVDFGNPLTETTYGTGRANAYKILEDSLNLRDSRIFDTVIEDGKEKRVLNKKETMLVSQKQETIREAFRGWIFQDINRREVLCERYNEIFNSNRPREYDGNHLTFPGMAPNITLRTHQKNAVAHQLYGNNTLLAHCVGAGKTYEMAAAAMESKRLGLAQKSLFVVPNHLTGQWASEFLTLYPGANILAATKRDFEPANRKKFCSRIATGDYDAVIIGHSQFEKIPLSKERQAMMIEHQIDEITMEIESLRAHQGERYTIKQMEKTKKSLSTRLERLNDNSRKDDVVTFEQLGVDRLFVDESHNYKNLFLYTKMRNVAGVAQTEAQKSSDMFAKCQYMDELTGGKGITFATGTPISNSMTELYTNMRYLQYSTLQRLGLGHFDSWAASFGETVTAVELAPEGTGYRAKTRFAKFFNLPELISIFKESADIQTPDMLDLPVPEAIYENVVLEPSEYQREMVQSLAVRAEDVRNGSIDATVDNMLKITNDGRKLALDQRLINDMLPDDENSKVSACVNKSYQIWEQTKENKSAQLIFCDLSTPKGKTKVEIAGNTIEADIFENVYVDIKKKLIARGVPEKEIAFIHEANTELRKAELFAKVRSGRVRFLLGSTAKMGAGTNVQDSLIAEHHLDVPWRPSDIEQREGRIIRQGNQNEKVYVYRYVTEGTFDTYSWQVIENKQKFISQIMTSKSPVRSCDDIDEASLTYAEVKALATGNPFIKEKMDLDIQVSKLKLLKSNHTSQMYHLEDNIVKYYPKKISTLKEKISGYQADMELYKKAAPSEKDSFSMKIGERVYTDKKEAGTALLAFCKQVKTPNVVTPIGEYLGYKMSVEFDTFYHKYTLNLKGELTHSLEIGTDVLGNLSRITNTLGAMEKKLDQAQENLSNAEKQLASAKDEVTRPFLQEDELNRMQERLSELNALLNIDKSTTNKKLVDQVRERTDYNMGENIENIEVPESWSIVETNNEYILSHTGDEVLRGSRDDMESAVGRIHKAKENEGKFGQLIHTIRESKNYDMESLSSMVLIASNELKAIEAGLIYPDRDTLQLFGNIFSVFANELESGNIVPKKSREDLNQALHDISGYVTEIKNDNNYFSKFMEKHGIEPERSMVHDLKRDSGEANKSVREYYVIDDQVTGQTVADRNGQEIQAESREEAEGIAESLSNEMTEIGEEVGTVNETKDIGKPTNEKRPSPLAPRI